jgi:hypothetical protein
MRPALNNWAGATIRMVRERRGETQDQFAQSMSAVLGPVSRSLVGLWERERADHRVGADVLLAAYVLSGLEPHEVARLVMAALQELQFREVAKIVRATSQQAYGPERAGIRELVDRLQEVDDGAAQKSSRPPRARKQASTASRGS